MTSLNAVFIDTSIFDSHNYNFESQALQAFVRACDDAGVYLVLPDPAGREIERHIKTRVSESLDLLRKVRKIAPFLDNWEHFPDKGVEQSRHYRPSRYGINSWGQFKLSMKAVDLDYSNVDLVEIMNWYDESKPPFNKGKKSKEFPDALMVSMLEKHANENKIFVAVVSADNDFKNACTRYTSLLYFRSLPVLTEKILEESKSIDVLRSVLDENTEKLEQEINAMVNDIYLHHTEHGFEASLLEISSGTLVDYSIIAVGQFECTIAYNLEAEIGYEVSLEYGNWEERFGDAENRFYDTRNFSGIASVKFDEKLSKIDDIPIVSISYPDVEVHDTPDHY